MSTNNNFNFDQTIAAPTIQSLEKNIKEIIIPKIK